MMGQIEWRDSEQHADHVLTMIAAILLDQHGGSVRFTADEWHALNVKWGGHAALLIEFHDDDGEEAYTASLGTPESVAQALGQESHGPN